MKICVYGAGAIGGYLAARMARAGQDVSVIARGPHLEAIRSHGLTLESPAEKFTVHPKASDRAEDIGIQDLVVITAKTPALPQIARSLHPLLGPETPVAFAVNGIFWFMAMSSRPEAGSCPRVASILTAFFIAWSGPNAVSEWSSTRPTR
jgi:2-dehydropantoate 2-reductase